MKSLVALFSLFATTSFAIASPQLDRVKLPPGFEIAVFAEGIKDGALFVAEVNRVWRYDAIEANLPKPTKPVLVYDKYPADRHHGWKFIRFGPDGWLYVPVGAPCNVCDREEPYATITRLKPDGALLVSDDHANAIYRITFRKQ